MILLLWCLVGLASGLYLAFIVHPRVLPSYVTVSKWEQFYIVFGCTGLGLIAFVMAVILGNIYD